MLKKSPIIMSAYELRHSLTEDVKEKCKSHERNNIHIVMDRVYDAFNIGSAFRIADSIFAKKVWICGKDVATPLDRQVQKSSVNTCELIEWEVLENTFDLFEINKEQKCYFSALEKINDWSRVYSKPIDLSQFKAAFAYCNKYNIPFYIIIGNESLGIDRSILNNCDSILELPMYGINNSMNVINALAIACSHLMW